MKKLLLILFVFIFSSTHPSFNFFSENISYCSRQEYELLIQDIKLKNHGDARMQNISKDFLWHLKIPTIGLLSKNPNIDKNIFNAGSPIGVGDDEEHSEILLHNLAPKKGQGIKIAVLDTEIHKNSLKQYKKSLNFENLNKIEISEKIFDDQSNHQKNQNLLSELMKKNHFFQKCLIKNHGDLTCGIIWQFAPNVTMIPISIMDSDGYCTIKSLCLGLQQALDMNVDIVHLGLKITDDFYNQCEHTELTSLLKKFSYVIVAAGNDGAHVKKINYLASLSNILFSVGAFECSANNYQVCAFSQYQKNVGPHFLLPGHRLLCPLWIDEIQDYIFIHTSGTSMASAIMTGFLAVILSEFGIVFTQDQITYVIKNCCKKLNDEWDTKVIYGTVDMRETVLILKALQYIIKKVSASFFKKNFLKIVQAIKDLSDFDNKNVNSFKAYANGRFRKKIDRNLYILVKDSIYMIKEGS